MSREKFNFLPLPFELLSSVLLFREDYPLFITPEMANAQTTSVITPS